MTDTSGRLFDTPLHLYDPDTSSLENVRGHLSLGAAIVVADLAALGYVSTWGLLGAPMLAGCHRRIRWWLAAADPVAHGTGRRRRGGDEG